MKTKRNLILSLVMMMALLLSACGNTANPEANIAEGDISQMVTQLTKQADEISNLEAQLSTLKEAPQNCPSPEAPEPCPECAASESCPSKVPLDDMPLGKGSISGNVSYPSQWIPSQNVYAIEVNTGHYYWVRTSISVASYKITGLPAGTYIVVSYEDTHNSAGYSNLAACGLNCSGDHELVKIELAEGEHKENINPIDWYNLSGVEWPKESGT